MIRSRLLNAIVLLLGVGFAALGGSATLVALGELRYRSEAWLFDLVLGTVEVFIGLWCCLGAVRNLRDVHYGRERQTRHLTWGVVPLLWSATVSVALLFLGGALEMSEVASPGFGLRMVQVGAIGAVVVAVAIPAIVMVSLARR